MSPREVIAAYLAVLNQMQHQIDLEYDKMAGALVDRLSDAGIVMVPRKATDEIAMVDPRYPCRELWARMVETAEATKP